MQRATQVQLDNTGQGIAIIQVPNTNFEWDIYQISLETSSGQNMAPYCQAEIRHNGFFLCSTAQGTKDTATGPPDTVLKPNDQLTVQWIFGVHMDIATVSFFYNENLVGGTYSTAH